MILSFSTGLYGKGWQVKHSSQLKGVMDQSLELFAALRATLKPAKILSGKNKVGVQKLGCVPLSMPREHNFMFETTRGKTTTCQHILSVHTFMKTFTGKKTKQNIKLLKTSKFTVPVKWQSSYCIYSVWRHVALTPLVSRSY